MTPRRAAAVALTLLAAATFFNRGARAEGTPPAVGRPVPAFTLPDLGGKPRAPLTEFKGKRAAFLFFCGCQWCAEVGKEWSQLQRGGALVEKGAAEKSAAGKKTASGAAKPAPPGAAAASSPGRDNPITVVVYSEVSPESAKIMADYCGFDPAQTVVLVDEDRAVTVNDYNAEPCPRVFVVDTKGTLRYTNDHKDDAPREAPAAAIVAKTVDALRAAVPAPTPTTPAAKPAPSPLAKPSAPASRNAKGAKNGKNANNARKPAKKG
jgi:peroxiredoxin